MKTMLTSLSERLGLVAVFCLVAASAGAQTKVWTNADLGKPLSSERRQVTDAELTGLTAHQFVYVPDAPQGPTVYIMGSSEPMAGPWRFPPPIPPRRLDGTLLDQPVTVYGSPYIYGPHRGGPYYPRVLDHARQRPR